MTTNYESRITLLNDRHWDVRPHRIHTPSPLPHYLYWGPMCGKERNT